MALRQACAASTRALRQQRAGSIGLAHRSSRPSPARLSTLPLASSSRSPFPPRPCTFATAARRQYSAQPDAAPSTVAIKPLTPDEYHHVADEAMDALHEDIEVMCEDYGSGQWEVEYSSGVMNVHLAPLGTYVVNKQPPNQQIWVSSPISGPSRFSLSPDGVWVHHRRAGVTLGGLLNGELKDAVKAAGGEGWGGISLK